MDRTLRTFGPPVAETSNPARAAEARGGVARNVAENLSRSGVAVRLISAVGKDAAGDRVLSETRDSGVNVEAVLRIEDHATGSYTAITGPDGNLIIGLADMEICTFLTSDLLRRHWGHIAASKLVFADANGTPEMLEDLLKWCRDNCIRLALDAVSVPKSGRLPRDLTGCDILFCNAAEARALTSAGIGEDPPDLAGELLTRGVESAIVTDGADGIAVATRAGDHFTLAAHTSDVVDVTGAGDAFIARVLAGLLEGGGLRDACRAGLLAGAAVAGTPERFVPKEHARIAAP